MSYEDQASPIQPKTRQGTGDNQSLLLPKVRKPNLSRADSLKTEGNQFTLNAAPATPRMLRSSSNQNGLNDEYTINADYQPQSKRSFSNSTPQPHMAQTPIHIPGEAHQDGKELLPGVEFNASDTRKIPNQSASQSQSATPSKPLSRSSSTPPQQQQQFHRKSIGDWDFAKTIGAGSMGKVKLAKHRITSEICAVKVVPRAAKIWERQHMNDLPTNDTNELAKKKKEYEKELARDKRTIREGALGRILYHPYICRLYEMFPMTNHYYMLFEYVSGGQMLDYIVAHGSLKERHARKFCRGIASALDYCHSNNIVHRDLKIENIMINKNGEIKIIDFGLSNMFDGEHLLKTYCGSLYFAAPELLSAHPYIGPEVDVWSFGVVLFVLVCGRVPFDDPSVSSLHEKIKRGHVEYPDNISKECVSLLSRMLVVDPSHRATLSEVLNHPWMVKGFEGPAPSYLPHRVPLQLPLDENVLRTIVSYDLGTEEQVYHGLSDILSSEEYELATKNWIILHQGEDTVAYDSSIPDPTIGYHPLVSIYYLVDEMLKRKKLKEETSKTRLQMMNSQPFNTEYQYHIPQFNPDTSTPAPPVLAFPQAAYTSRHPPSSAVPASQLQRPRSVTQGSASPTLNAAQGDMSQQQGLATSLFRRLSSKRSKNDEASEGLPPAKTENEMQLEKSNVRNTDMVRRVGSLKITSKEKQQLQLPPLPSASKQLIQSHQRAASAYTASAFSSDAPRVNMQEPPTAHHSTATRADQKLQPDEIVVQESRRYHPSARAKSVGHARKHSLNIPKSTPNSYAIDSDAPPVPQIHLSNNADDEFFDDVDMDEVTFQEDYTKPTKRLSDTSIMSQFEHSIPGSMPSIEYPKTLFLKGFFSVQTTSTKPLPIIRYDIINVLPQLGVKFTEVKGGFVCIHYPSIVSNDEQSAALTEIERTATVVELEEIKTPVTSEESSERTGGKRTSMSSLNSTGKLRRGTSDEPPTPETPVVEGAPSTTSSTSTPSRTHRRKFSLGNGLLGGYRKTKDKEKLTVSTNVSHHQELSIPTTPAPANFIRRNSYDSSESINFDEPDGGSDMLVSSRVEQQNKARSPTVNQASSFDAKDRDAGVSVSKAPLKFEIHIVKVPLIGLYGVQFKKVSGNTWLYKSLASEILNRLNL
ncbi:hypothetical protein CANARDRAFT_182010, partial [[Candida] arabinofermentans NRRL YB-2248]